MVCPLFLCNSYLVAEYIVLLFCFNDELNDEWLGPGHKKSHKVYGLSWGQFESALKHATSNFFKANCHPDPYYLVKYPDLWAPYRFTNVWQEYIDTPWEDTAPSRTHPPPFSKHVGHELVVESGQVSSSGWERKEKNGGRGGGGLSPDSCSLNCGPETRWNNRHWQLMWKYSETVCVCARKCVCKRGRERRG